MEIRAKSRAPEGDLPKIGTKIAKVFSQKGVMTGKLAILREFFLHVPQKNRNFS